MNGSKIRIYFAFNDFVTIKEWIKLISVSIKIQPEKIIPKTIEFFDRNIQIWENEVELGSSIGDGATAQIFIAMWHGMKVAVKRFRGTSEKGKEEFVQEVKILQKLRHPSIILFIGAYFTD